MKKEAQPTVGAAPQALAPKGTLISQSARSGLDAARTAVGSALKSPVGRVAATAAGGAALGYGAYRLGKKVFGKKKPEEKDKAASVEMPDHVDLIRHFFNVDQGQRVMESTFGKQAHDPHALVRLQQSMELAAGADPELMKIAMRLAGDGSVLEMYERLGGTFKKEAFGTPMFQPPSMPQAPAMGAPTVAQAPKPAGATPQASAPQVPKAPQLQAPQPGQQQSGQQQPGQQQPGQQKPGGQQIKVQLQSPAPGQQGTSVSIG